jgi:hypothetical protein
MVKTQIIRKDKKPVAVGGVARRIFPHIYGMAI